MLNVCNIIKKKRERDEVLSARKLILNFFPVKF